MPKIPRDLTSTQAARDFVRAGGIELQGRGKGSHCSIQMPNGETLTIPYHVRVGLIGARCFGSGNTLDELEKDVREAIESHIAALREVGKPVPERHLSDSTGTRRWEIEVAVA